MAAGLLEQPCYVFIAKPSDADLQPNEIQVRESLEHGSLAAKTETLKKLIFAVLNGEKLSSTVLMYIIRFCLPSQDHMMKKLLLVFWEIVPKTTADGKLMQEMILVCDAYRKDLQHPNEFVRGSTLRFLCRLKEPELIEPLMPSIRACLEYRHSYVRRNAVLAAFTIYKNFDFLIPDAPELVHNFLETEQDASCKRNAFMMLLHADRRLALDYLSTCIEQVTLFSDILQLIIVQLIYAVCTANPAEVTRFIRCVYNLLQSSSSAVRYEAASVLISLTSSPAAIRASVNTLVELINKESDNNVKLIVIDRLVELRDNTAVDKVLQDVVMDLLRVLQCQDLEVQKRTLNLVYDLVSPRNVDEVITHLRKEIAKTAGTSTLDDTEKYRQILVKTIHSIAVGYPEVATNVVPALIELLGDAKEMAAVEVLVFIREAVFSIPGLRQTAVDHLLDVFPSMQNVSTLRFALWILSEYCQTKQEARRFVSLVRQTLGKLPANKEDEEASVEVRSSASSKQLLNPDGTYTMHTALSELQDSKKLALMRKLLYDGDFFFFAALSSVLTKVALRYCQMEQDALERNKLLSEVMFIEACVLQFGQKGLAKNKLSTGDSERIKACLQLVANQNVNLGDMFLDECRQSLGIMLATNRETQRENIRVGKAEEPLSQPDQVVGFSQLQMKSNFSAKENLFDQSLSQALGQQRKTEKFTIASTKLDNITQLSGFSDPVYAEALITLSNYDITLDCLIVNQTGDTLECLTLELATLGDLKLVDKPSSITLAPHDFATIKTSIKVSSTENGVIFGTLSYDVHGSTGDRNCIYLNDIHVDIMDYITPVLCSDEEFRQMWSEFEWENKVAVMTRLSDLREYLAYLVKQTNMRCLTPDEVLSGESGFLAANLYARSVFGEDALANLSIEKATAEQQAPVVGHIRIRAKSQGMALSLGDRISRVQKAHILGGQNS
uniref:Coatomer subunit beta n=1 Tax=Trichuris muris TaxID=70415 RepID=A0A5S6R4B0_TRIMR